MCVVVCNFVPGTITGILTIVAEITVWWQRHESASHAVSRVRKQRKRNAYTPGAILTQTTTAGQHPTVTG